MSRIRQHLRSNIVGYIALFFALSTGSAVALGGSNTVQSDDLGPGAQVKAPDVAAGAVGSAAVINESLTGQDIKNRSGVETCQTPLTARRGPICVGSDGALRTYQGALSYCAGLGLRLPSHSEAVTLAVKYDVPGVPPAGGTFDFLWTDAVSTYVHPTAGSQANSVVVDEDGGWYYSRQNDTLRTVCVTDPSA
jgi:hypothetical protein